VWTSWFENGQVHEKGAFKMGVLDGRWEAYYQDGKPEYIATYVNGAKNGEYKKWYENGLPRIEGFYKDDLENGHWKKYHEKGGLMEEGDYSVEEHKVDNKTVKVSLKAGKWTVFFPHGAPSQTMSYKFGKLNGKMTMYYSTGVVQSECNYVNDLKHGVFKVFDKDGKLVKKEKYEFNRKVK
jgi:antitoxin component YwqK of YwqJK toxin-antitoxin module